jgi:hypothetical protein
MLQGVIAALLTMHASVLLEPNTEQPVPAAIEVEGRELRLTGADLRRVMGKNAYALAHYAIEDTAVPEDPAAALEFLRNASVPKALIFRGAHDVPARGIRWSWGRSLSRVDYKGTLRSDFIDAFVDFEVGGVLCLYTDGAGTLKAVQDGKPLGEWNEPELVRAVWDVALGEEAEVVERLNLARPDRLETCAACPADTGAKYEAALAALNAD